MSRARLFGAVWAVVCLAQSGGEARADPSALFAKRLDAAALDQSILEASEAASRSPQAVAPRLLLARAESFWAELHADAPPEAVIAHLQPGVAAAREALRLISPGFAEAARQGATLAQALEAVEPSGAEALYWIGACQHQLAAERGLAALLLEADDLRRIFARTIELAPETFHGGAHLHAAEIGLALPQGYATSLATAAESLAQAERYGHGWLWIDVVWAERWAVKAQDYAVFKRKLQAALEAPPDALPDLAPENELARRRAQKLVGASAVLFTRAAILRGDVPPTGQK